MDSDTAGGAASACPPGVAYQSHGRACGAHAVIHDRGPDLGNNPESCVYLLYCGTRPTVCVGVCVCVRAGYYRFYQVFPVGPVWPHWRPRVGLLPIIAGLRCRPGVHPCIAPRPVRYALRPEPGSLPQDHPGSGVVAPWLPLGQLHGNSSTSPSSPCCPVCCVCIGVFTAGGARGSEAASTAYSIWRFPQKGCP